MVGTRQKGGREKWGLLSPLDPEAVIRPWLRTMELRRRDSQADMRNAIAIGRRERQVSITLYELSDKLGVFTVCLPRHKYYDDPSHWRPHYTACLAIVRKLFLLNYLAHAIYMLAFVSLLVHNTDYVSTLLCRCCVLMFRRHKYTTPVQS